MLRSRIVLSLVYCAGAVTVAVASGAESVYRIEKQVVVHAWKPGESKLAAEASFVGVCAIRTTNGERSVEEYLTGGMLSDLGEELPPRPPGQPLHWTYKLNALGDVETPLRGRGGLAVWTLPFELYLLPRGSLAEARKVRHGVREFTTHAAKPAGDGIWAWRIVKDDANACELGGPCTGKFEGGFSLSGTISRTIDPAKETIRSATATLAITIPVAARVALLAGAPDRQAEEAKFFEGYDSIVVHETARLIGNDSAEARQIELPVSLESPLEKLTAAAATK